MTAPRLVLPDPRFATLAAASEGQPSEVLAVDPARDLTYRWFPASPDPKDEAPRETGLQTSAVLTFTSSATGVGECVGFLRVSYTTDAFVAERFPRLLAWAEPHRGWRLGYQAAARGYGPPVTPAHVWVEAHRAADAIPASIGADRCVDPRNLTEDMAPADPAVLDDDLRAVEDQHVRPRFTLWRTFASVPFVSYANVAREHRQTGIGRALYLHTARRLAIDGLPLRAGVNQTVDAQALWARLLADPTVPTGTVTLPNPAPGQPFTAPTLDYR